MLVSLQHCHEKRNVLSHAPYMARGMHGWRFSIKIVRRCWRCFSTFQLVNFSTFQRRCWRNLSIRYRILVHIACVSTTQFFVVHMAKDAKEMEHLAQASASGDEDSASEIEDKVRQILVRLHPVRNSVYNPVLPLPAVGNEVFTGSQQPAALVEKISFHTLPSLVFSLCQCASLLDIYTFFCTEELVMTKAPHPKASKVSAARRCDLEVILR